MPDGRPEEEEQEVEDEMNGGHDEPVSDDAPLLITKGECLSNYLQLQMKPVQRTIIALRELRSKKSHRATASCTLRLLLKSIPE
jgi:hypothetical protein